MWWGILAIVFMVVVVIIAILISRKSTKSILKESRKIADKKHKKPFE